MEMPQPHAEKLSDLPISLLIFDRDRFRGVVKNCKDLSVRGSEISKKSDDVNMRLAKSLAERIFLGFARTDGERREITKAVYAGSEWFNEAKAQPGVDVGDLQNMLEEQYAGICAELDIKSHPSEQLIGQVIEDRGVRTLTRRIVLSVLAQQFEEYRALEPTETGVRDCA